MTINSARRVSRGARRVSRGTRRVSGSCRGARRVSRDSRGARMISSFFLFLLVTVMAFYKSKGYTALLPNPVT